MKKIVILGITGSIGTSACDVIREHSDQFQIMLASANNNLSQAISVAKEFKIPQLVMINDKFASNNFIDKTTTISYGANELKEILKTIDCDIVLNAISGSAGLEYSIIVLERGIKLALANKESLIMAGHLIKDIQKKTNAEIIPVDSEHSAIFQSICQTPLNQVRSLIITASGGPFRTLPLKEFDKITISETLKHPTWEMGAKVTIDSATMMNKGLEVIEAHWLFEKDFQNIEAIIHPQSIIHSLVEFIDGSILAQLSFPTMKLPILYAFSHPIRLNSEISQTSILDLPDLTFEKIPNERYPLFFLALKAGKKGDLFPAILNAANEAAISLFLNGNISFVQIYKVVDKTLQTAQNTAFPDLETIIKTNESVYQKIMRDYKTIVLK